MDQKNVRDILNCESGVSEIIGAIMLLAVAVSVIALIQTESVPEWNKAVELDHSNEVYYDFLKLKSDIEDVALFQFPKSGLIHMGAHYPDRMIFLNPTDTSGILTSRNDTWINVSFTPYNSNETSSYRIYSTSITFQPGNNYYTNAPRIAYEHGLIIKNFTTDNYIYTDTDQTMFGTDTVNILSLNYPEDSRSFSGINLLNFNPESINSTKNNTNVTVTFYTNYPQLWSNLLKKNNNLNYYISGNTINVMYTGNTTINMYIVNGSLVSGIGVSTLPTEFTYVFSIFDLLNITGSVTNFPAAQDAGDGDASVAFEENISDEISDSSHYTFITSNTDTTGTTSSFASMQSGSDSNAYATLSEGSNISSDILTSPSKTIFNGTQGGGEHEDEHYSEHSDYSAAKMNTNDGSIDVTNYKTINGDQTITWTFNSNQESWTSSYCCKTGSGTVTMAFASGYGNPSGSLEAKVVSSSSATTVTTFWNSTNFSWTNGPPDTVSFTFKMTVVNYGLAYGSYWVDLIKPDGSVKTIKSIETFSGTHGWENENDDALVPGDFSQNGNYSISLVARLATSSSSEKKTTTVQWDTPTLSLTKNLYSIDATYSFTQTKPNSSWVNITISDSSYAPAGTDVFIYNQTSSTWESIRTSSFIDGTIPSPHVNNKVIPNPSNYDTGGGVIKIKYEGIGLDSNSNIGIDLLQPVFYFAKYNMNISTTIASIPGDTDYVLQTRYLRGNTNEAGYNMSIWNYTSSTWGNMQNLTALSWTENNMALTSGQISGGQVKTRFSDQTPDGISPGNLYIDYQRVYGISSGTSHTNRLNITTITTGIPDAGNYTLQVRYYVSQDSFTLQVWNGSYWNNKATLTETSLYNRDIPLLSNELIPQSDAEEVIEYYILVRYLDLDTNPTQQGRLYIDYQRIYRNY